MVKQVDDVSTVRLSPVAMRGFTTLPYRVSTQCSVESTCVHAANSPTATTSPDLRIVYILGVYGAGRAPRPAAPLMGARRTGIASGGGRIQSGALSKPPRRRTTMDRNRNVALAAVLSVAVASCADAQRTAYPPTVTDSAGIRVVTNVWPTAVAGTVSATPLVDIGGGADASSQLTYVVAAVRLRDGRLAIA